MAQTHYFGQRMSLGGAICTVRYVGDVAATEGVWLGVEWDDAARGKHDGSRDGIRYFSCASASPTAASFVRPNRPAEQPQSFVAALREKYASEAPPSDPAAPRSQVVISGKVAEEMGFDKIRHRLAQLAHLRIVILDGMRIATATRPGEGRVADTCPSVAQLDLSRNLFERLAPVVDVCAELPALRRLSLNGNRFHGLVGDESLDRATAAFRGVHELALGGTLLGWEDLCRIATCCPSLTTLAVGANQLSSLPPVPYAGLASTLTSITLEYNSFEAMSDLTSLASLAALRNLHLKGNNIAAIAAPDAVAPVFPPSLRYLDVSYNRIREWSFVDALPAHFPGLTGLRIAHNPVYDGQDTEDKTLSTEESHMFTIARFANLKSVNFTHVKPEDRRNAEMFYLSRIAKQLAAVPESAEDTVLALHPRYPELCTIYGEPDVIRRSHVDPSFLEARLVTVRFHHPGGGEKTSRIPKAFDIYSVRGIAGKLFGLSPLKVRLIWETGEWDPAAGIDDQDVESSDDDFPVDGADSDRGGGCRDEEQPMDGSGRWSKREVELTNGPRQLGYCVDGLDVSIRVELA